MRNDWQYRCRLPSLFILRNLSVQRQVRPYSLAGHRLHRRPPILVVGLTARFRFFPFPRRTASALVDAADEIAKGRQRHDCYRRSDSRRADAVPPRWDSDTPSPRPGDSDSARRRSAIGRCAAAGHGGYAQANVVEAGANHVPGQTKLLHLGTPGRIAIPGHPFRQRPHVLGQRRLPQLAFVLNPKHVVIVQNAPHRRERISPTPVDAADTDTPSFALRLVVRRSIQSPDTPAP